jgi:CRP-like cAMP-binding protein
MTVGTDGWETFCSCHFGEQKMLISNARNSLLGYLSHSDSEVLAEYLEPVDLPKDFTLTVFDEPITHHYFLETGVGSMVAVSPAGKKAEIGLVGHEGMVPFAAILGPARLPFDSMIQIAGRGQRVETAALLAVMADCPTIGDLFRRYAQSLITQIAYTALTNVSHNVDVRLARWLLMCHDRVEGAEFELTHEYMSIMLGVRRSSVTDALHVLEGEHFIYSQRGRVIIRDRSGLERFAGDAYGVPEREYADLMRKPLLATGRLRQ